MDLSKKKEFITYLRNFVTKRRSETILRVLDERTRYLCVVLEDIYQPQNASAVLRSCDCFGVQDVHIIENKHDFKPTRSVTIGAEQWLTLHRYNQHNNMNTKACYSELRRQGYKVIGTTPHEADTDIANLSLNQKTALVFGSELDGLSDYALKEADQYVQIPIYGFSESYNISVSAALCLYEFSSQLRKSDIAWQLGSKEKIDLELAWLEKSIRAADQLKSKFFEEERK